MKKMKRVVSKLLLVAAIFGMLLHPETVKADEAKVIFGSESYSWEAEGQFPVGVYIRGDSQVGAYHVELKYDNKRLKYVGGAESENNGTIIMEGTGVRSQVKYMLYFEVLSGGEAYIEVKNAYVNMAEGDGDEAFDIVEQDYATITLAGEDTVVETEEPSAFETDIPHIEPAIVLDEKEYYLLDVSQQVPESVTWKYQNTTITFMEQQVPFLTNEKRDVFYTYIFDETEKLELYAYSPTQNLFYPCELYKGESGTYLYTSPYACEQWPEELTLDIIKEQNVFFAMNMNGEGGFYKQSADGVFVEWDEEEGKAANDEQKNKILIILLVAVAIVAAVTVTALFAAREIEKQKRRKEKQMKRLAAKGKAPLIVELDQATKRMEAIEAEYKRKYEKKEKPVISVQDVTMKFRIATSNVSGIKEYFIQLLKKQISYRELLALDHVSFDVFKGEVVGIIGTNGSGKSTLLRIVSGALDPTEGRVLVNRRKLQLLTLGTGFDMELTAKENVYLNGAIIGYTEEFINEHYDEIVEFAELEGFMEEKVKNFSSGMVSRLGFAIATVGEASDILILDEVLSVGDEFFRKKSLARVKEMIHGGSTVLMVSHSIGTILENCSKVVWIEKGELKMVGEPKEVCAAYQNYHK